MEHEISHTIKIGWIAVHDRKLSPRLFRHQRQARGGKNDQRRAKHQEEIATLRMPCGARHLLFGHGLAEILTAVQAQGSLKEAAKRLDKSYRYVWGRVKEAEQALGKTLVDARVGGQGTNRSFLTEDAVRLLADFSALRSRMLAMVEQEFSTRFRK